MPVPALAPHSQPCLHDAIVCVDGPTVTVSARDGHVRGDGAEGVFQHDHRVLRQVLLRVDGVEPAFVAAELVGASGARFVGAVHHADHGPDPAVLVERERACGGLRERITVRNHRRVTVRLTIQVAAGCDLAHVMVVKEGQATPAPLAAHVVPDGLRWDDGSSSVALTTAPSADTISLDGTMHWDVTLDPSATWTVDVSVETRITGSTAASARRVPWTLPTVSADDHRLSDLVHRAVRDLEGLAMTEPDGDLYVAAGAPWFLTLFGRDSLWAARMLLPLGTDLAAGTLRALARHQGRVVDPATEEAPGKILHEMRTGPTPPGLSVSLPPLYYGTVDATPLWLCLLHDAWRWGMPADDVAALLPTAERALAWMSEYGDADGDGFLEYVSRRDGGLANQGWKDSADGIQFADGVLATAPLALSEVQGYAYEAAMSGARLLDAFGRPGGDAWRAWAAELADQFRERFWLHDAAGPYVAVALDADKNPVDAVTSNMGHLLGTGIVTPAEADTLAARLTSDDMLAPYGLRTMSTRAVGFNPLGYHSGSVWPHDTAIVAAGLARSGHRTEAARLLTGLLHAAPSFGYRLPELFGGQAATGASTPVPYPHACAPQAWSAASAVALLQCALGIDPAVPDGEIRVAGVPEAPWGRLDVRGLRVAGAPLSVRVSAAGAVEAVHAPAGLTVRTGQ